MTMPATALTRSHLQELEETKAASSSSSSKHRTRARYTQSTQKDLVLTFCTRDSFVVWNPCKCDHLRAFMSQSYVLFRFFYVIPFALVDTVPVQSKPRSSTWEANYRPTQTLMNRQKLKIPLQEGNKTMPRHPSFTQAIWQSDFNKIDLRACRDSQEKWLP